MLTFARGFVGGWWGEKRRGERKKKGGKEGERGKEKKERERTEGTYCAVPWVNPGTINHFRLSIFPLATPYRTIPYYY